MLKLKVSLMILNPKFMKNKMNMMLCSEETKMPVLLKEISELVKSQKPSKLNKPLKFTSPHVKTPSNKLLLTSEKLKLILPLLKLL